MRDELPLTEAELEQYERWTTQLTAALGGDDLQAALHALGLQAPNLAYCAVPRLTAEVRRLRALLPSSPAAPLASEEA